MSDYLSPSTPDMSAPRYTGLATFMRTPIAQALEKIDIGMVGIPYDGALTNRPGARHGPREVRNQSSLMRSINHATRINPYELCQIADVGDVPFKSAFDIERAHDEIFNFIAALVKARIIPLSCGGDHSVSLPLQRNRWLLSKLMLTPILGTVFRDQNLTTVLRFVGLMKRV